jgi:dTDP-glucose 4,6-dehydratase
MAAGAVHSTLSPIGSVALVTGAAGFIGSAVVRRLRRAGMRVVALDALTYAGHRETLNAALGPDDVFVHGDVTDTAVVADTLLRYRPQSVVHLAAETHVDRSIDRPLQFVTTNVLGTAVLLDEGRRYWQSLAPEARDAFRFVHVSTDEVYGALGAEGLFTPESPHRPNSPYAASKSASDQLARAWHRTFGFPVVTSNCGNNYGPFQFPEKLIPLTIRRALAFEPIRIYGTGEQVRDWLYVDDHADALYTCLRCGAPGETYLIGGGTERQNLQVARAICALIDELSPAAGQPPRTSLIELAPDRPGHDFRYALDVSSTTRRLGWTPATGMDEGLRHTVRWYLDNRAWCDAVTAANYAGERLGLGDAA